MNDLHDIVTILVACGGIGAFLDFLIGKAGQKRIKDTLESIHIRLAHVRVATFARDEAVIAYLILHALFGSFFSLKRLRSLIWISAVTVPCIAILTMRRDSTHDAALAGAMTTMDVLFHVSVGVALYSVSLSFSLWLTRQVASRLTDNAIINATAYLTFVVLQAYCAFLSLIVATIPEDLFYQHSLSYSMSLLAKVFKLYQVANPFELFYFFVIVYLDQELGRLTWRDAIVTSTFMFYAILPALLRLALSVVFFLSLLLRPFHTSLMYLLDRIVESEKPVLTLLFAGLGAAAALIQKVIML